MLFRTDIIITWKYYNSEKKKNKESVGACKEGPKQINN
jgi:hypothetical protein